MSQVHRLCWVCGVTFPAKRRHARYCSGRCRTAAYRKRADRQAVADDLADEVAQAEAMAHKARAGRRKADRVGE